MNVLADATLPGLDEAFPDPFRLTPYSLAEKIPALLENKDVLLCRSTLKVDAHLLKNQDLRFVATASSGTDHIDHSYLKAYNIQLLDAKGCNAESVADYVLSSIAYLEAQGLFTGQSVGIIGMGKVGTKVHSYLQDRGYSLCVFDPLKAENQADFKSCAQEQLYSCDLICIHAELHATQPYPSLNLINKAFLERLKPGCILLNASRGGIVDEDALLEHQPRIVYCTDVYLQEPTINQQVVEQAVLCTPHIAGHSLEAKYAAVAMLSEQLHRIAHLPIPKFASPLKPKIIQRPNQWTWQQQVLSLYNPIHETEFLKNAQDKRAAFLSLRQGHQHRHDFSVYLQGQRSRLDIGRLGLGKTEE